ncbi:helix-turn-helix domain-containing protein [Aurantimonas coralicida]|uniref:helix-turn-helix domain-containing protein n=1 Tax=Aurantimonas coralicida TaxID=182270 RepID=UPI001E2BDAD0|nr:helix-turn-helix transcriptional regulator [Aurantimonas coralicida]MCD1645586.1 helix-turn-helix domain-containing protein [Aurantimonas coralicida]|tara:strand:- start:1936 stop:2319 length:384 start_codon:yes stop_codon:yes gene_type:complete
MRQQVSADKEKELGARLRGYRNYRGMSQSDLGKHLGVTFQQVQKYEKGVNRISGMRILEIAKLLGISVSTLLGEDSSVEPVGEISPESLGLVRRLEAMPKASRRPATEAMLRIIDAIEGANAEQDPT